MGINIADVTDSRIGTWKELLFYKDPREGRELSNT
jgi:hypothetical protein